MVSDDEDPSNTIPSLYGARQTDSFIDTLADLVYPLYEWRYGGDTDRVKRIDQKLSEAAKDVPVELFLSRNIAIGLLVGLALWLVVTGTGFAVLLFTKFEVGTLTGLHLPDTWLVRTIVKFKAPALVTILGLFFGWLGMAVGFRVPNLWLYLIADDRKREINMLLPDAVSYMYALSEGGMNQLEILEAIAQSEDVFGEVSREFQIIVQDSEYFDTDYRTAIRNRSVETPSDELRQFLTDMLSIINSGGDMTGFLDDKKDKHMRTAKRQQEKQLETLELFGEMYMTLSMFPLLLIILLVIMAMMGNASDMMLYLTVYALIPGIGFAFIILISTAKQDERGGGYLTMDEDGSKKDQSILTRHVTNDYAGESARFNKIHRYEGMRRVSYLLRNPHELFIERPWATFLITIPGTAGVLATLAAAGYAPTSWGGMIDKPFFGTLFYAYLPLYLIFGPLTIFYEWKQKRRFGILDNYSESLRKLASANDTGLTILESFEQVAQTSTGRLSEEYSEIHAKVSYGATLREALVEFNNRFYIPRLARIVTLITEAQETSSQITDVLNTAAQLSENQDEIEAERKTQTRMQIVIIIMTFVTLLGVMAMLKFRFLEVMGGLVEQAAEQSSGGGGGGGGAMSFGAVNIDRLSMLFFHAVTLQAICAGFICGYLRESKLLSSGRYIIPLSTIALVVWYAVTFLI